MKVPESALLLGVQSFHFAFCLLVEIVDTKSVSPPVSAACGLLIGWELVKMLYLDMHIDSSSQATETCLKYIC